MIYVTSDLHFGHDREFIWKVRGFSSIDEMNEVYVDRWNSLVTNDDDGYILGDLMLGSPENIEFIRRLNGRLHIVYGNHCTPFRRDLYNKLPNLVEANWVIMLDYKKYHFYMSHFPTLTGNLDDLNKPLKNKIINLCGHTHTTNPFVDMDKGIIYHCEVDAHNSYPVLLDNIINDIKNFTN